MAKRMLIDATHPEETRVVVLNGSRLEEFDFESSTKKQVKGNIYLAKITRVEPSLQAAFVEYGGNRHGFLAFSEIHPDYYRIPVADRGESSDPQLFEAEASETFAEPGDDGAVPLEQALPEPVAVIALTPEGEDTADEGERAFEPSADAVGGGAAAELAGTEPDRGSPWEPELFAVPAAPEQRLAALDPAAFIEAPSVPEAAPPRSEEPLSGEMRFATEPGSIELVSPPASEWAPGRDEPVVAAEDGGIGVEESAPAAEARLPADGETAEAEIIETLGGDEFEDAERQRSRAHRHYKIQEVVKRRQIMLVQVTKEERGNKGAALTTYLSLAGRYCVLMPNTARGGGVSRKITSISDRRRLKDILEELDIPEGMGVIVRTAGAERSKAEIKRDYEYLLRLWNEIRELTLQSTAPALIYEEGNLIKRSIRDLYTRDLDEVLVEGEDGYRTAKAFMKMLMPSHAKRVQPYRDPQIGLLHRFQIESQIDAIHSPVVQLRSGGYVVIDQTEALVAIDVNSGRSTRERNIEETALRTNLEAAEEIARQLRLRDLAGLIVIDFIDMEEHRNQGAVERRLKEALKSDRARIQVGRISPFGLLEMSRQRLRPSLVEASTQPCPHCGGTGTIRSTESTALYVLRSIEEEGMRRRSAEVCVYVPTMVALYILNHKRESLAQLEMRYGVRVLVARDDTLIPPAFRLERLRALEPGEAASVAAPAPLTQTPQIDEDDAEDDADEIVTADDVERPGAESEDERGRVRRRRRRRRRHEDERVEAPAGARAEEADEAAAEPAAASAAEAEAEQNDDDEDGDGGRQRRRRGRRGGRRRGRREEGAGQGLDIDRPATESVEIVATGTGGSADQASESDRDAPAAPSEGWPGEALPSEAWPTEIAAVEPASEMSAIETASLPAFSGDALPSEASAAGDEAPSFATGDEAAPSFAASEEAAPSFAAGEDAAPWFAAAPAATTVAAGDEPAPMIAADEPAPAVAADEPPAPSFAADEPAPAPAADEPAAAIAAIEPASNIVPSAYAGGNGASPPAEAATMTVETGSAGVDQPPHDRAAAPLAAGSEPVPEPANQAGQLVQEVTKKPENPRRGWWQRLIQS